MTIQSLRWALLAALGAALPLAACDSGSGQDGGSPAPAALASGGAMAGATASPGGPSGASPGAPRPSASSVVGQGGASAPVGLAGEAPPPEWAGGPWPSVAPAASPEPDGDPNRFFMLQLSAGLAWPEVAQRLAGANMVLLPLRQGGQPPVPAGEAWAYVESAYPANAHEQSLWLRARAEGGGWRLQSLQANPSPADREAVLGTSVAAWNARERQAAWAWVGAGARVLVAKGQDLEGEGAQLVGPRSEGGDADVEGRLRWGQREALVPLPEDRFTEAGHLAEAFLAGDGRRLVLWERLPFSGLRVPMAFQLGADGQAFAREAATPW